jgi:hypothetical protein
MNFYYADRGIYLVVSFALSLQLCTFLQLKKLEENK